MQNRPGANRYRGKVRLDFHPQPRQHLLAFPTRLGETLAGRSGRYNIVATVSKRCRQSRSEVVWSHLARGGQPDGRSWLDAANTTPGFSLHAVEVARTDKRKQSRSINRSAKQKVTICVAIAPVDEAQNRQEIAKFSEILFGHLLACGPVMECFGTNSDQFSRLLPSQTRELPQFSNDLNTGPVILRHVQKRCQVEAAARTTLKCVPNHFS